MACLPPHRTWVCPRPEHGEPAAAGSGALWHTQRNMIDCDDPAFGNARQKCASGTDAGVRLGVGRATDSRHAPVRPSLPPSLCRQSPPVQPTPPLAAAPHPSPPEAQLAVVVDVKLVDGQHLVGREVGTRELRLGPRAPLQGGGGGGWGGGCGLRLSVTGMWVWMWGEGGGGWRGAWQACRGPHVCQYEH